MIKDNLKHSVLVFSRDPGPTNLLIAVINSLSSQESLDEKPGMVALRRAILPGAEFCIMARGPAIRMWEQAQYSASPWSGQSVGAAQGLIRQTRASLVLTGSSDIDEFGDRDLWQAANALGVESHVVIDHPASLSTRFNDRLGRPILPDHVYVADAEFSKQLIEAGHARERVHVVGDLHHARLRKSAKTWTASRIVDARTRLGAVKQSFVVLFASECMQEMTAFGYDAPYNEIEVVQELIFQLARGELPDGGNVDPAQILLVIRPHPRDTVGKYDKFVKSDGLPRTVVQQEGDPIGTILAVDLIVGMCSSLLFEAFQLDRPVFSLTKHDIAGGKGRVTV